MTWAQDKAPKSSAANAQNKPAETKITPQQAEALFREVDTILAFVSKDSGLPIKHEVKRKFVDRDGVVAYLKKSMDEDKDTKRLQRSELVLKKFGLLPQTFDLQTFLVALLREQIAGYYDAKTKTVNLLDWLEVEQQRPVLAHELTHALQDQSIDLEQWMKAGDVDLDEMPTLTPVAVQQDEVGDARQAVVEGQAMVTLVDYMLAPTGQTIVSSPQIANALKQGMLVGTADSPEFQNAPIYIKEALTFPYRYGIDFIAELLRSGGKERAFASALANPPYSSRQIMEPATYLSGEAIPPLPLPNFNEDFKNYERFDVGAMGELDTSVLIDQYADAETSQKLYPSWRGGYYYAARLKANPNAPLAIFYFSRWATPESASSFGAIYAAYLSKRYTNVKEVVLNGSAPLELTQTHALSGTHTWTTEAGALTIRVSGTDLMIAESLDQGTTEKLEREMFPATAEAAMAHR
jgi:hypothetical protein